MEQSFSKRRIVFLLSRGVCDEGSLGSELLSHKGSLVADSSGK
jgi:hypothetical protein